MKSYKSLLFVLSFLCITVIGCKEDEKEISPSVFYNIELNDSVYENGDSLYGYVEIDKRRLIKDTEIKKIDCRLGNVVIGTTKNQLTCPFGVRIKDKPVGTHTLSIIVKCETPGYLETFWRYDLKIIHIIK